MKHYHLHVLLHGEINNCVPRTRLRNVKERGNDVNFTSAGNKIYKILSIRWSKENHLFYEGGSQGKNISCFIMLTHKGDNFSQKAYCDSWTCHSFSNNHKKCEFPSKWSIQTYFSLSRTQARFLSKQLCFQSVNVCNSFKFIRLFTLRKLSQDDHPVPHWRTGKIIALQWTDQNNYVRFKKKEVLSYLDSWLKYIKLWPKWMPKVISQRRKLAKKPGSSSRFSQRRTRINGCYTSSSKASFKVILRL